MNLLLVWTAVGILGGVPEGSAVPSVGEVNFRVTENSPSGTVVGVVPHAAGATRFELAGAAGNHPFDVDPATGRITVRDAASLDFERQVGFAFTVRVTTPPPAADDDPLWKSFAEHLGEEDGDRPDTITEQRVRVQVVDANEPPSVAEQWLNASGADAGAPIGTVVASDPDAGDRLAFTLTAGNESGAFEIHPEFGLLTIHSDRLTGDDGTQAVLGVRVTDRSGLAGDGLVMVRLPERSPPIHIATSADPPVEAPRPSPQAQTAHSGPSFTGPELPQPDVTQPQVVANSNGQSTAGTAEAPQPAVAPPTLNRGISPLLVGLLALLGGVAHVIRVQFLRRRGNRGSNDVTGDDADRAADRDALEAGLRALTEQRQLLAGDITQLAEDQARFADEQQQLGADREELAAQQVRLAAAEADLDSQRAELERERRELDVERLRLEELAASPAASTVDDVYAIDDEERDEPAGGAAVLEPDPDLAVLRSNLADMFGIPVDAPVAETRPAAHGVVSQPALELSERTAPPGSRESLYQRKTEAPASSGHGEVEGDSINSYMEALMKRLRQNTAGVSSTSAGSAAPRPSTVEERAPAVPSYAPSVVQPAVAPPSNPTAAESDAPPRRNPVPRSKPDKAAVRDTVNSLREVANLSARSAMATYFRRKRTRRGVLVGLSYVALLALATALLMGVLAGPVTNAAHHWLVLGMGVVVIVHYLWAVCLSDYRRGRSDRRFSAKPRPEPANPVSREPAPVPANGQPDRVAHGSVAPRRSRPETRKAVSRENSPEPAEDNLCAVSR